MSADNYLFVRPFGDRWAVSMEFASVPPAPIKLTSPSRTLQLFATKSEALDYAYHEDEENYYEYGVIEAGPDEQRLQAIKAAEQTEMQATVSSILNA